MVWVQSTLDIVELQKIPLFREKLDIVEFLLNKIIFGNLKKFHYNESWMYIGKKK